MNLFNWFKKKPNQYANYFNCNLHKDKDDYRDYLFAKKKSKSAKCLPSEVSFIEDMPPIWNQESIGSCQSFALDRVVSYFYNNTFIPSHLYVYYNVRQSEADDPNEDCGGTLRGTLKSINKTGVCTESLHPYIVSEIFTEPSKEAYANGIQRIQGDKVLYYRANNIEEIKQGMTEGYLPYIGVIITDSFYSDKCMNTGVIPMPKGKEYGGHALLITKYETTKNVLGQEKTIFTIDNSWGQCGNKGRFTCADKVLKNILMDCWLVRIVPDDRFYI